MMRLSQWIAFWGYCQSIKWPPIMGVSGGKLTTDLMAMVRAEDTINPARVPHYLTELPKKMNYWHRILNHVMYLGESFIRWSVVVPVLNNALQKPYETPSVQLMLLNTHPVLDYVQNLPPNIIEVGGLHISSTTEAMPEYIEEFMEQYLDCIIYINLRYIDLMNGLGPDAVIQMIKSYPDCGFIWNAHNLAQLPEKLPNLLMCDNINQHNILAQFQIKAFLNHGDSFSLQDAIYYAVPLIVLPLILEEFNNAQRIRERALGVVLNPSEFTLDSFVKPLKSVLNDATYTDALYQSQIKFRNRPQSPVELAIWHAEQLISEPHMYKYLAQPDTFGQNYFVNHSLDVLTLPFFLLITFVLNLMFLIYQVYEVYKLEKLPKKLSEKQKKLIKDKKKPKTNTVKQGEAGETSIGAADSKESLKSKDE
ncbi:UDP-glucosyltransferase 2 [Drosophila tropicalis]|uniref:UDP-glucosyltransferase 2 n=1 Tax=Drosophila tropicalis TaxID=46794 RepID=UPI0035AC26B3